MRGKAMQSMLWMKCGNVFIDKLTFKPDVRIHVEAEWIDRTCPNRLDSLMRDRSTLRTNRPEPLRRVGPEDANAVLIFIGQD